MYNNSRSPFLSIFIIIATISFSIHSNIITTLSNTNFPCDQQYLLYQQTIPTTSTEKFIIINSLIENNRGDIITKVYPTKQVLEFQIQKSPSSKIPTLNNIIHQVRKMKISEFGKQKEKDENIYQSYLDLESLFTYSNSSIIKIDNDEIGNKITKITILFYRVSQNRLGNYTDLFGCINNVISYRISSENIAVCPTCSAQNSLAPFLCTNQGYCVCKNNYIGKDCQLSTIKLFLQTEDQVKAYPSLLPYSFTAQPMSRQHYYFILTFESSNKLKIIFQQPNADIRILISKQIISHQTPQITTANVYNHDSNLLNSFNLLMNQHLLITIANMGNEKASYILKIEEQTTFPIILRVILITLGCFLFSIILCIIFGYGCFAFYQMNFKRQRICNQSEYPEELFPTIRFYEFRLYILGSTIPSQFKQLTFKSLMDMGSLTKKNSSQNTDEKQKVCSICLQQITDQSLIKYTFCNHIHDAKCLDEWMNRQANCPLCREPFDLLSIYTWRQKIKNIFEKILQQKENQKIIQFLDGEGEFNDTLNYFTEADRKENHVNISRKKNMEISQNLQESHKEFKRVKQRQVLKQNVKGKEENNISAVENQENKIIKKLSQMNKKLNCQDKSIELNYSPYRKSIHLEDQGIDEIVYRFYKSIWLFHQKQRNKSSQNLQNKNQKDFLVGVAKYQDSFLNEHEQTDREEQLEDPNKIIIRKRQIKTSAKNYQNTGWTENLYNYQQENNISDFQQQN